MSSIIIFLFVLGILIVVHEFGHFIAAKKIGVKVEKFCLGFGPSLLKRKKGDTEYAINLIPLGGYVKLAGDNPEECKGKPDEYLARTPFERARIVLAGPIFNYILGFLCFWLVFSAGYPVLTTKVGGLIEGFGAKDAGVQVEDKIIAIDGQKVNNWEELQKVIQAKKAGKVVRLLVIRQDKEISIDVGVKEKESTDPLARERKVSVIGIMPKEEIIKVRQGLLRSFILSVERTLQLTIMTYKAVWFMVSGRLSLRESAAGPIGMLYVTHIASSYGITALLNLIALISINLAVINLMPLPVLDGGHILLLILEKIRGRALGIKAEHIVTQIGVTLIATLGLIVIYNDILNYGDKVLELFLKWR